MQEKMAMEVLDILRGARKYKRNGNEEG